jgi:hypothetical protein
MNEQQRYLKKINIKHLSENKFLNSWQGLTSRHAPESVIQLMIIYTAHIITSALFNSILF